jgi:HlyD family secretion protein
LAEIQQLLEEENRLKFGIAQAKAQLINTTSVDEQDVRDKLAENDKQIAEIDSQLTKIIVDNDKRIAQLNSDISRTEVTLQYQEVRAPVSGTVFDLQAGPGYVTPPTQTEPMLKIVPDETLVAEVYVTNQDIGFVELGQKTDVRIDSFSYTEFGDIKGEVKLIGTDALPPDEIERFYRFPVRVSLDKQYLTSGDKQLKLQSGMSVNVNIKVRENRTVLSLFTERFINKIDSFKKVR